MDYGFIDLKDVARVGVIKNNKLVYYKEYNPDVIPVGSIIRARIVKKLPWLESYEVFIEGDTAIMPFKHKLSSDITDQTLVQVINEPIDSKKARVTEKIKIKGRYLIVDPYSEGINISKKIENTEHRERLKTTISELNPKYGIIIRTEAGNTDDESIIKELRMLEMRTDMILKEVNFLPTPKIIYWQKPDYYAELEEYIKDIDQFIVNSGSLFEELKAKTELVGKISLSRDYSSLDDRNVQFELGKKVSRKIETGSGAEIVIDELEALTVVDVNSSQNTSGINKEENALRVNLDVVDEIMFQIMIRGIGGIILIDFIRMKNASYRELDKAVVEAAMKYKINLKFTSLTKAGLYEFVVNR